MDIDFKSVDLYELFDVSPESTETEIKKAYRKKALIYHPDKNPDDPKANEVFQKLSKALEVLTDKEARTSYDKILNAKKEREIKNRKLDAKRRKLKDELDAQEKFNSEISIRVEEDKLKQEIERIRKEGSRQLEDENYILKKKIEQQRVEKSKQTCSNRVKIKRKGKSLLSEDLINECFDKFGKILFVIISKNKKSAIIEFENYDSIKLIAINCPSAFDFEIISVNKNTNNNDNNVAMKTMQNKTEKIEETTPTVIEDNQDEYEDYVLRRLQEAEKNKRPVPE